MENKKQTTTKVTITNLRRDKTAHVDLESEVKSLTVPDSDFHIFNKDRMENSFDDNQVWVVYNHEDGIVDTQCLLSCLKLTSSVFLIVKGHKI